MTKITGNFFHKKRLAILENLPVFANEIGFDNTVEIIIPFIKQIVKL